MFTVAELRLGSIDAINYRQKSQKQFLSQIFFRDDLLDNVLDDRTFFLLGEKGTGKTAYATFLSNSDYRNTISVIKAIIETDYRKFINLKNKDLLQISDYNDIWRVIILLMITHHIIKGEKNSILSFNKFKLLKDAIDEFYSNAFNPELSYAIEFIEKSDISASLLAKYAQLQSNSSDQTKTSTQQFQMNLIYLRKRFEEGISSLKLDRNHIIFIDGIDIRPQGLEYKEYLACIKGLAQAVWSINSDFLCNIKDSRGRIKVVLLCRPDIFGSLGLQNSNAKVRDNSVYLDWRTTYGVYRTSRIFQLIDGILGKQQANGDEYAETGLAWDYYFPYEIDNMLVTEKRDNPFIGLLRYSLYRPRDIISYLLLMQDFIKLHQENKSFFSDNAFKGCQQVYSDYLLGEIKDQVDFYYSDYSFDDITLFFSFLGGKNHFSYDNFLSIWPRYKQVAERRTVPIGEMIQGPEECLQFLYNLNIIGYREIVDSGASFVHWCFRDRTLVKINPQVRFGLDYNIHPGLSRALQVGSA